MGVLRIVPNLPASDPAALATYYTQVFGLTVEHDMGWIAFLAGPPQRSAQLQIASEGGSGTDLPANSNSVDDLDEVLTQLQALGDKPVYGPIQEPWGVRRLYPRDPAGNLINVVEHHNEDAV